MRIFPLDMPIGLFSYPDIDGVTTTRTTAPQGREREKQKNERRRKKDLLTSFREMERVAKTSQDLEVALMDSFIPLSLSLSVCLSLPYIYTQRLIASDAPPLFPVWDVRL